MEPVAAQGGRQTLTSASGNVKIPLLKKSERKQAGSQPIRESRGGKEVSLRSDEPQPEQPANAVITGVPRSAVWRGVAGTVFILLAVFLTYLPSLRNGFI